MSLIKLLDACYYKLKDIPRWRKSLIILITDFSLVPICLYISFSLRLDTLKPYLISDTFLFLLSLHSFLGLVTLAAARQYRVRLHSFDIGSVYKIGLTTTVLFLNLVVIIYLFRFWAPRSVPIIFSILFFLASSGTRVTLYSILKYAERRSNKSIRVAIYGTGETAMQVLSAMRASSNFEPVCFFDENPSLHGATIANIKVENPANLDNVIAKRKIVEIYLALQHESSKQLKNLAGRASVLGVKCQIAPQLTQLLVDHNRNILQETISTDDLIGRKKVDLFLSELASAYAHKVLIVTGAGGSIGSEISRQLIECKPSKLILLDNSEFALFKIFNELAPVTDVKGIELVARLGSVLEPNYLKAILKEENVDICFHAAAYKHVPLVEDNMLSAVQNNVIGTVNAAKASGELSLEKFVLISSDKAVRPTNVMGASKRLAELLTANCEHRFTDTTYSVVRFGNVLGSSGSVVPLFREQIEKGGPITVTHPEITRYFMTIPEAAKLVMIAGCFSKGADLFVLDMGEPIKIVDLAKRMIKLSGYSLKNENNSDGDIAIKFTGLRPGEKMFEELFLRKNELTETPHEKIFRVKEQTLSDDYADKLLMGLKAGINNLDNQAILNLLTENVEGFDWKTNNNLTSSTAENTT